MKFENLIKILFLLLNKKKVTAKEIASRFDISIRTVYRYLDELSCCIPIYNEKGRNGGYSIYDDFKIHSTYLTKEEKQAMLKALKGIAEEINSKVLYSAIDKISSITKEINSNYDINFNNLIIDCSSWDNFEEHKEKLTILSNALETNKTVHIKYADINKEETERDIEPYSLILKQGLWYVYAYCKKRNSFRLFKLGRITAIRVLDIPFERNKRVDVKKELKKWYSNLKTIDIELLIDKSIKNDVEEWLGIKNVYTTNDNLIKACAKLPENNELIAKILSFGNKIKVLSPTSLKTKLTNDIENILKLYK